MRRAAAIVAALAILGSWWATRRPTWPALDEGDGAILFFGDVLLSEHAERRVRAGEADSLLAGLAEVIASAGAAAVVVNHEGSITARTERHPPNTGWSYAARTETAGALARAGVTHASLANNHAFDRGPDGLADTIAALRAAGIEPFGAGVDAAEAGRPAIVEVAGSRIAVLGAMNAWKAYRSWRAQDGRPGLLLLRRDDVARALAGIDADMVIAYPHWGREYQGVHRGQRDQAGWLAELGVDAIVGHHTHEAQGFGRVGSVPVAWSLGNALFGTYGRFGAGQGHGLALRLIVRDGRVDRFEAMPLDVHNRRVEFRTRPLRRYRAWWWAWRAREPGIDVSFASGVSTFRP